MNFKFSLSNYIKELYNKLEELDVSFHETVFDSLKIRSKKKVNNLIKLNIFLIISFFVFYFITMLFSDNNILLYISGVVLIFICIVFKVLFKNIQKEDIKLNIIDLFENNDKFIDQKLFKLLEVNNKFKDKYKIDDYIISTYINMINMSFFEKEIYLDSLYKKKEKELRWSKNILSIAKFVCYFLVISPIVFLGFKVNKNLGSYYGNLEIVFFIILAILAFLLARKLILKYIDFKLYKKSREISIVNAFKLNIDGFVDLIEQLNMML